MGRLLLAILIALTAGCGSREPADPYAKYRDAQIALGMTQAEIVGMLGQPDDFDHVPKKPIPAALTNATPQRQSLREAFVTARELLGEDKDKATYRYSPFGAHNPRIGHVTKYRLTVEFIDEKVVDWKKEAPLDSGVQ